MFIQLTTYFGHYKDLPSVGTVWVNPNHITYMSAEEQSIRRYDLTTQEFPTPPVEEITLTTVSFVAGLQEKSDSIKVIESPEDIIRQTSLMQRDLRFEAHSFETQSEVRS